MLLYSLSLLGLETVATDDRHAQVGLSKYFFLVEDGSKS
jgi:hypothetical protein